MNILRKEVTENETTLFELKSVTTSFLIKNLTSANIYVCFKSTFEEEKSSVILANSYEHFKIQELEDLGITDISIKALANGEVEIHCLEYNFINDDIAQNLDDIKHAKKGRDVRQAIHDSIFNSSKLHKEFISTVEELDILKNSAEEKINLMNNEYNNALSKSTILLQDIENCEDALENITENETNRNNAENARIAAENTRIANETTRENAEQIRIDNETERNTKEELRINKENTRITAENSRIQKETERINAEATRNENETSRIEEFEEIKNNLNVQKMEEILTNINTINSSLGGLKAEILHISGFTGSGKMPITTTKSYTKAFCVSNADKNVKLIVKSVSGTRMVLGIVPADTDVDITGDILIVGI